MWSAKGRPARPAPPTVTVAIFNDERGDTHVRVFLAPERAAAWQLELARRGRLPVLSGRSAPSRGRRAVVVYICRELFWHDAHVPLISMPDIFVEKPTLRAFLPASCRIALSLSSVTRWHWLQMKNCPACA